MSRFLLSFGAFAAYGIMVTVQVKFHYRINNWLRRQNRLVVILVGNALPTISTGLLAFAAFTFVFANRSSASTEQIFYSGSWLLVPVPIGLLGLIVLVSLLAGHMSSEGKLIALILAWTALVIMLLPGAYVARDYPAYVRSADAFMPPGLDAWRWGLLLASIAFNGHLTNVISKWHSNRLWSSAKPDDTPAP